MRPVTRARRTWGGRASAAGLFAAALLIQRSARAGNVDSYYLSGEAALLAGAITASARGGGAAWDNPAGLASLPGLRFDASINAFSLRFGGRPDFNAGGGSQVERLTKPDFNIVPSGLTVTYRMGNVGLALGLFVPQQHETFLRTRVAIPAMPGQVTFAIDSYEKIQDYAAGPSFGVKLAPSVDFGASLFATYHNQLSIVGLDVAAESTTNQALFAHQTLDAQQLGLQGVLGLQLHPRRGTDLGFTLRLPAFQVLQLSQSVAIQASAQSGAQAFVANESAFEQGERFSTSQVAPMRLHAGVAHDFGGTRLAFDGSYQAPLRNAALFLDWGPTLNARIGGKRRMSDKITLGGGLYTDRSPLRAVRNFGDSELDFYGITLAFDWSTHYDVSAIDGQVLAAPRKLRFGTTIAFSYALGVGHLVSGEFANGPEGASIAEVPASVVAHELILHISSSLSE